MYPYELFWGIDLYSLAITLGVVVCLLLLRLQGDMRSLRAKLQNDILSLVPMAVVLGYGAAVLIQGLYNIADEGGYVINAATGATFYGGLLGGTIVFISLYFGIGHFRYPDGYHKAHFRDVLDMAPAAITAAHGLGRVGCLMAGCCHGAPTDAWYGIYMVGAGCRVVPVQLFEALFLEARRRGVRAVTLEVRVSNQPAIALYEKFGFATVGRRKRFYTAPVEDAFVMECLFRGEN